MCQFAFVQLQSIGILIPLAGFAIHDQHTLDLWEFCKNDLVLIFYAADSSIFEEVAVALVIFIFCELFNVDLAYVACHAHADGGVVIRGGEPCANCLACALYDLLWGLGSLHIKVEVVLLCLCRI